MNDTSPLAQAIAVLLFLLACLSLNAQTHYEIVGDMYTLVPNTQDSVPKRCCGFSETELTISDRTALRLYQAPAGLKWYDFSTYRFKGNAKQYVWGAYLIAGILHGGRETYHAQPDVFERRFNARPTSFFGSQQWKRQYYDNNPELPHKPNAWNGLRDYWHFSGATTKYILIGGAFTIGASKQPVKYRIIDTLIAFAGFSASASLTYTLLR